MVGGSDHNSGCFPKLHASPTSGLPPSISSFGGRSRPPHPRKKSGRRVKFQTGIQSVPSNPILHRGGGGATRRRWGPAATSGNNLGARRWEQSGFAEQSRYGLGIHGLVEIEALQLGAASEPQDVDFIFVFHAFRRHIG